MAAESPRKLRLAAELADTESGEMYRLVEERKRRTPYQFGSQGFGQVSLDQLEVLTAEESGIPGDWLKVLLCCAHKSARDPKGGATAAEIAAHTGFTAQAVRRIVKTLTEHHIFLVAEVIGRVTIYKPSPHIFHKGTGEEHAEVVQGAQRPTVPGKKPGKTPKEKTGDQQQSVPRAGRGNGSNGRGASAAPQAQLGDALRRQGWPGRRSPGHGD